MSFEDTVLEVIAAIPRGEVMTYGEVAAEAGHPGAARAVGNLLRTTAEDVPWWRVVGAGWRLVSPAADEQRSLLQTEGWILRGRTLVVRQRESRS